MRSTRISYPLPLGKGFSMGRVVALAAILALTAALPARAESVTVTLDVSLGEPLAHAEWASCAIEVPADARGARVLDQAVEAGCISSWSGTSGTLGTFVDCIDEVCGNAGLYWRMTENGAVTDYGIDRFRAEAGDTLGFSYTQWATCVQAGDPVPPHPLPC